MGTRSGGRACKACCTFHPPERECPGDLAATGPERPGWRVVVETPAGVEAYGVLVAPAGDEWRARILTFPNILWLAPGTRFTLKFAGRTPQEAESQAIAYVEAHCRTLGYVRRDGLALVDTIRVPLEGLPEPVARPTFAVRAVNPRKLLIVPARFGTTLPLNVGQTINVSVGGVCIGTTSPLTPGLAVALRVDLRDQPIALRGEVVWNRIQPEPGRPLGMGIRLFDPPEAYVRSVEAIP